MQDMFKRLITGKFIMNNKRHFREGGNLIIKHCNASNNEIPISSTALYYLSILPLQ